MVLFIYLFFSTRKFDRHKKKKKKIKTKQKTKTVRRKTTKKKQQQKQKSNLRLTRVDNYPKQEEGRKKRKK